ncbi:hypothetical protein [Paenibacillus sp. ISL-20]|uniref:hypothetical protein n=1 Tax=Paenibacillus sp. ISL-20 TaxID=2819163 RepID=UPI001BEC4A45|nr:hypothetical protein [Paenibacillus sp. ISL-20]MBT2763344.1 hypothetical protein [Paenibacillus sp. ISL-20]
MVDIITVVFGVIGTFTVFNLLFACLYLFSKTLGNGFYRWIVHDLEFLMIVSFPLFGPTQFIASQVYERFNWFAARVVLIFYSIGLMILAVIFFMLFGYFADMT